MLSRRGPTGPWEATRGHRSCVQRQIVLSGDSLNRTIIEGFRKGTAAWYVAVTRTSGKGSAGGAREVCIIGRIWVKLDYDSAYARRVRLAC